MEKFGIFNLLGSFLGQSVKKEGEINAEYSYSAPPPLADKESISAEKRASFPPLQNSMLTTMKNHDEFVKRVRDKNKKPF